MIYKPHSSGFLHLISLYIINLFFLLLFCLFCTGGLSQEPRSVEGKLYFLHYKYKAIIKEQKKIDNSMGVMDSLGLAMKYGKLRIMKWSNEKRRKEKLFTCLQLSIVFVRILHSEYPIAWTEELYWNKITSISFSKAIFHALSFYQIAP